MRSIWNAPEKVVDSTMIRLVFPTENMPSNVTEIQIVDESLAEKLLFSMITDFSNPDFEHFAEQRITRLY